MTIKEPRNRIAECPECGGKLSFDRDAVTSETRFIYRSRLCISCGAVIHTKQPPEEIAGIEFPPAISVFTEQSFAIK